MEPLLSIIIPMYNSERYIGRCIESLRGLHVRKEVIVVDDGSTDRSCDIARKYVSNGEIKFFHQENHGVSAARNLGLDKCSGDVVAFVDSDDFIISDCFQSMYNNFTSSEAEMAMGGVKIIFADQHTEARQACSEMAGRLWKGDDCFAKLMQTNTFTPLVFGYMYKKAFLDRVKLRFRHRMSEDDLWTSIAMCEARHVQLTNGFHYVYCKNADSITGTNVATIFRANNHLAVANDLYDYLCNHKLSERAEAWLCCKILYIASIAVKIYTNNGYYMFSLSLEMFKDLFSRVIHAHDEYARKVGLMFGGRLIDALKSIYATSRP